MEKQQGEQPKDTTAQTSPTAEVAEVKVKTPKVLTAEIVCVDCGAVRVVGKGEVFQVKRCVKCQDIHRKGLRKTYRKEKANKLRDRIKLLESLLHEHKIGIPA